MRVAGKRVFTLFGPEEPPVDNAGPESRGRDPELVERRNEHLCYRFLFYRQDMRNSWEWLIKTLAEEFYLTESTVGQIIAANGDMLARIKGEKPTLEVLRKKYPFFNWKNTAV